MALESMRKCRACDGTGDQKRRADVLRALKQQCPICLGEGMVLNLDQYEAAIDKGDDVDLRALFRGGGPEYSVNGEAVAERVFRRVLAVTQQSWRPKPKKKSKKSKDTPEVVGDGQDAGQEEK